MLTNNFENEEPVVSTALVSTRGPAPPAGISEAEADDLRKRAREAVDRLKEASGSRELTVLDAIASVGMQSQRRAAGDLELLRARVGDLVGVDGQGASGRVAHDLGQLRLTLNRIDPNKVAQESLVRRFVNLIPFGRNRLLGALETIAVRYEPVSKQVAMIETRLREGRMLLNRDNIELRKLYEQVEIQQADVLKNCYLAELLMQELDLLMLQSEDPLKRDRVQGALFDVGSRAQDLRTMDEVDRQLFVSIEMTRQNNTRLGQAVDRSLTLVGNVVMVGLAIQTALMRQRRVLEATQKTREFLGDLLVANAGAVKQHTEEIGDVYKSPVIAIEKIEQAHQALIDAIDAAGRLREEGIAASRENILKLTRLAGELEQRAGSVAEGGSSSLEA
jgi:uncharacterized protein YaaN involved in tellurite resistance